MSDSFETIRARIIADPDNQTYTERGIAPLYRATAQARLCVVGQAPGRVAEQTKLYWNDLSGDRLRTWMGLTREQFYHDPRIAVLPMDFYYPGRGQSGDLPPRKGFANKWHPLLIEQMPQLALYLLVGSYAYRYYLGLTGKESAAQVIQNGVTYWGHGLDTTDSPEPKQQQRHKFFPIVHPSPRNNIWLHKNPWFEIDIVPNLRWHVARVLGMH